MWFCLRTPPCNALRLSDGEEEEQICNQGNHNLGPEADLPRNLAEYYVLVIGNVRVGCCYACAFKKQTVRNIGFEEYGEPSVDLNHTLVTSFFYSSPNSPFLQELRNWEPNFRKSSIQAFTCPFAGFHFGPFKMGAGFIWEIRGSGPCVIII